MINVLGALDFLKTHAQRTTCAKFGAFVWSVTIISLNHLTTYKYDQISSLLTDKYTLYPIFDIYCSWPRSAMMGIYTYSLCQLGVYNLIFLSVFFCKTWDALWPRDTHGGYKKLI